MFRPASLAVAGLVAIGCSRPTPTRPKAPRAKAEAKAEPADDEPANAPRVYRLPTPTGKPAPWAMPVAERVISRDAFNRSLESAAVGAQRALVGSIAGYIQIDRTAGVLGTIEVPDDTQWVGLDRRDRVVAATADGAIWGATASGFERLGTAAHATMWDLSGDTLVASDRVKIHYSRDAGASFTTLAPPEPFVITTVLSRSDGAVVIQGHTEHGALKAYAHAGGRWTAAPKGTGPLQRFGDWITASEFDCGVVLGRNGRRWVEAERTDFAEWSDAATVQPWVDAIQGDLPAHNRPRAPVKGDCDGTGGVFLSGSGGAGSAEPLRGTSGPASVPATRWFGLFVAAASWAPQVAAWSESGRSLQVRSLPPGCDPTRLDSAAGVGILRCKAGDGLEVWIGDSSWHRELTVPGAVDELRAAADGTLLLHGDCEGDKCDPSWLRRPVALGASAAWVELTDPSVVNQRVLAGGRALLIRGGASEGYALSITDGERETPIASLDHDGAHLERVEVDAAKGTLAFGFRGDKQRYTLDPGKVLTAVEPTLTPGVRVARGKPKLAAVGDVNGDGWSDVAVLTANHTITVFYGGESRGLDAKAGFTISRSPGRYEKTEPVALGDVNGDGLHDIGVAITRYDFDDVGATSKGSVVVVFGRPTDETIAVRDAEAGSGGFAIRGGPSGASFAQTVVGVGDIDGDGKHDIAIGYRHATPNGDNSGRVYVVYGRSETAWVHLRDVVRGKGGFAIDGDAPASDLGASVAGLGDVNGDGHADFASSGRTLRSFAHAGVVFGGPRRPLAKPRRFEEIMGKSGFAIVREPGDATLQLVGPGDVNGDKLADILVVDSSATGGDVGSGRAYVVFGKRDGFWVGLKTVATGRGGFAIDGDFAFDGLKGSAAGDLTGDGLADLLFSMRSRVRHGVEVGGAAVVAGRAAAARIRLADGSVAGGGRSWSGTSEYRLQSVIGAGDVDGDGTPDIVAAARHRARSASSVFIVKGAQ